ncbi:MAG TPA: glycosyltransferase [Vicinamibacteria bacterium]|jgi:hypothetical protein|nr:glycosyltransferase [Vicinamibacteria bacterium]
MGPDLTVVLETTTGDFTGACDSRRNLTEWMGEAASLAAHRAEIVLASPAPLQGLPERPSSLPLRQLIVPGAGYYALKNAAANEAQGALVFFSDLDCRPTVGCLRVLMEAFADREVGGVAGRSYYDGQGLVTRIGSAHSWGDLHRGQAAFERAAAVAHNVAIRRELYARDPFGPFAGRIGGDRYLTEALRSSGRRFVLEERLILFHEDPTWRLRGLVERHLRDTFVPLHYGTNQQRFSAPLTLACALGLRLGLRLKRVALAGKRLGIGVRHLPVVIAVEGIYWALDLLLTLAVLAVPSWRRRWLAFLLPNAVVA